MTPMSRQQKLALVFALIGSGLVYGLAAHMHKQGEWDIEIVLVPIAFFVLYPVFRFLFSRFFQKG